MVDNIDDLPGLAAFALVVREGSFTAAARRIGVTKATVSKRVQALERRHGAQLLHRTTRRVRPTGIGSELYESAALLLEVAEHSRRTFDHAGPADRGRLRITAPVGVGEQLVAPVVAGWASAHPDLGVELVVDDAPVDLAAERFDLGIRAGLLDDDALIARRIAPLTLVLCGGPAYLARRGAPRRAADLARHAWVLHPGLGQPQQIVLRRGEERRTAQLQAGVLTNGAMAMRAFVEAGLGLGLLPDFVAAPALHSGTLVRVLPRYHVERGAIHAVYPATRFVPRRVRAFLDHLVEHLGSGP